MVKLVGKEQEIISKYKGGLSSDLIAKEYDVGTKATKRLLEYVGDCPVKCFNYKWGVLC